MLCLLRSQASHGVAAVLGVSYSHYSQAEGWLCDDLEEVRPTAHQIREDVTEGDVLPYHGFQPTQAIAAHNKPDLERTETSSQRELPIPVVNHGAQFRIGVPQVAWRYIQRFREVKTVTDKEAAG